MHAHLRKLCLSRSGLSLDLRWLIRLTSLRPKTPVATVTPDLRSTFRKFFVEVLCLFRRRSSNKARSALSSRASP